MTRRTSTALAAFVAMSALALSSCSSAEEPAADPPPATSTPSPSASPSAASPPVERVTGACYRLSYDEAVAPTSTDPPIGCEKGHTTQTFAVGRLDLDDHGHLLAVDSDAAQRQVARRCPRRLAAYLGATQEQLRLSLLRTVWFTPTIEESDLGAAWYRCDVIAVIGDKTVAKVTGDLAEALRRPAGRAAYGMCGTAQPGTDAFSRVLCREDHTWKAISVVDLAPRAKARGAYPGEKVVRAAGQDICADAAREIASDALDYEWGYEWPTQEQWDAGQTYGRCWSPDPA